MKVTAEQNGTHRSVVMSLDVEDVKALLAGGGASYQQKRAFSSLEVTVDFSGVPSQVLKELAEKLP